MIRVEAAFGPPEAVPWASILGGESYHYPFVRCNARVDCMLNIVLQKKKFGAAISALGVVEILTASDCDSDVRILVEDIQTKHKRPKKKDNGPHGARSRNLILILAY